MSLSADAKYILDIASKSSEVLHRSFNDLALMQSSPSLLVKSFMEVKSKSLKFIMNNLSKRFESSDCICMLVDNENNFLRAIPFFSTIISVYRENSPFVTVVALPALKEVIWSQKGIGTYMEDMNGNMIRASVSPVTNKNKMSIDSNVGIDNLKSSNFGSVGLSVAYVSLGRLDAFICRSAMIRDDYISALSMMVLEARGKFKSYKTFFAATNGFLEVKL